MSGEKPRIGVSEPAPDTIAYRERQERRDAKSAKREARRIARAARPKRWPDPTMPQPTDDEVADMRSGWTGRQATDGCWLDEIDDVCRHGHRTWVAHLDE